MGGFIENTGEKYTVVSGYDASHKMRCPLKADDCQHCDGFSCMAWIMELDEDGMPTGKGRCGMVASFIRVLLPRPAIHADAEDMTAYTRVEESDAK